MGKPADLAIDEAKKDIAAVVRRFTEIAAIAVAKLTPDEIAAGFALPLKDAPKWTGLVERIVSAAARGETSNPSTVNNSLQLVMVGKAASTEQWLEAVQGLAPKRLPPIDVKPEPKK